MAGEPDPWAKKAKQLLRVEMVGRSVTYDELANLLAAIGVTETPANLRNKISRGKFTAAFLLQCLRVLGCNNLRLD
jgi:hypothetical protein